MNRLDILAQKLRRRLYRRRFERGFADALVDYESVFQEVLSDLYNSPATPRALPVDIGWICDLDSIEAIADRRAVTGTRIVQLSVRWFSDFQTLANAIFRSRDMYPSVGEPETTGYSFAELLEDGDADADRDAPADPLRHEAACVTVEMALSMIVLHEIGHHACGHLDLGDVLRLVDRDSHHPEPEVSPELAGRLHACEIEADRFAFSHVLGLAAVGRSPFSRQLVSADLRPHLFSVGILAYSLVIALLHTRPQTLEECATREHPHPAVRLLASQRHFAEILTGRSLPVDQYMSGWRDSLQVICHNAEQQATLALLVRERPLLERRVEAILGTLERDLRPATKRYDFAHGIWK